ncbi:lytic transglycosylase domain-containing protein, partial [Sneathiella sp.]|uniref:lytic transglycosylase domain-containing protein n=1 Tax=Sneathiella sp. TaxID=1964365 RepID=UPI0035671901
PKWPLQQYLRRRAEEALDTPVSAEKTLDWFATEPPASGIGMLRYGEALINQGRKAEGINWIKQAWTTGYFTNEVESDILVRHKGLLTRIDHEKRLDHLLWERNIGAATRLFPYVGSGAEKLAVARIRLMKNEGNVDSAVRAVPADLQNDPGLIFERAKWRRKQSLDKGSLELLLQMDSAVPRADKWWRERHIQARNLLLKGQISDAYQLASRHGLDQGADFAAAEWLSGWIALRFQNDGKKALQHFLRLYENVSYPISRARAAYWIGRAQASLSDPDMAQYWYKIAARDYTTYYGQMALHELGQEDLPTIPKVTKPDDREVKALGMTEQVTAVRNLAELDMPFWAKSFLLHMAETVTKEESYVYLARLATKIDRPDYAIAIAKRASQLGTDLTEINWPTPSLKKRHDPPIEPALTLAITRQESAFAADAVSGAGARGLMQLMPATAEAVSRQLNVAYSKNRLTDDPVYNTQLGSSYLAGLIDEFEGSYVLAIAAYNAGPRNVRNWLRDSGDPRSDDIDVIDWIELIPFSETRNYVQRVMENLQIYRQRLTPKQVSQLQINRDINRGVVIQ